MLKFHRLVIGLTLMLAALPSSATELAVLRNGFSIQHERREVIGAVTRLYVDLKGSSYIDVPTVEIEYFEPAAAVSPAPDAALSRAERAASATMHGSSTGVARPIDRNQTDLNQIDLNQVVAIASGRYRLDPDLVNSVIRAESGFNVRAVSPKGAQGLMQLMPQTAAQLGVPDALDPQANVEGGTRYLRELLERYNFDLIKALAAYNAGPQRVERYGGVPPYYETRAYVARIVRDFNRKKIAAKSAARTDSLGSSKNPRGQGSQKQSRSAPQIPSSKSPASTPEARSGASLLQASK